jgi:endoglycosylceramidase
VAGASCSGGDAALQQSLGFNALRLGALWAGVSPSRGGGANASYLAVLAGIARAFGSSAGIATLVDAHQDLLSEAFCADGAPAWLAHDMAAAGGGAAFPLPAAPSPCAFGPDGRPAPPCCSQLAGWADYYLTSAVGAAFAQLYTNATFVAAYADFWRATAAAFAPLPGGALLGYEAMNEPWAGDVLAHPALLVPGVADRALLQPFYGAVAAAIRGVAPDAGVIFYEGVTWDDVFPLGFDALPGADAGLAAISYHYYDLPGLDCAADAAARAADGARLRAAPLLTEFAVYPDGDCPDSLACMRAHIDVMEARAHGYIGWEYATLWRANGTLFEDRAYEMARPFAMAVAGALRAAAFDRAAATLTLNFTAPRAGAPAAAAATVVFVSPGLYFPRGYDAALAAAPAGANVTLDTPCWAGAGAGGAHVDPPGMRCAQQ